MQWIGCTVCEIAFKLYCDLETGIQGHSRSSKVAPLYQPTPKTPPSNRLRSYGHFCISKMAVSSHLGFYWIINDAIRSADSENPSLEQNMEWIGCTVCKIFTFKLDCDLDTEVQVTQGHRKWHYSIERIRLYASSVVNMRLSITVSEI